MTRSRIQIAVGILIAIVFGLGTGLWWYLFGTSTVAAAELVPSDTIAFATIPNAAEIVAGYQTSQLKTLVDSPNAKPLLDQIPYWIGQKNFDLLTTFAPNLSGQSFIALTHFDPDHPEHIGLIAGMKPKAGLVNFNAFVDKLKTSYPDALNQGTTGTGNVAGVDYQSIQGPGAPDKLCVAHYKGWIITSWGEASLQDWLERYQKKPASPSLAQNPDYIKSLARVGKAPMTFLYVDCHAAIDLMQKQMAKISPTQAQTLPKMLTSLGGFAVGTRFENGEIADRFSVLISHQAQAESGIGASACNFETLKFTGASTRFYTASSIDWQQVWKNAQVQSGQMVANSIANNFISGLQTWAQGAGLDVQHNIIDPLGPEISMQVEWSPDLTWPEAGLFVKLDKPDNFKPTITAIIETARKAFESSAVIKELSSNGQAFAALQFVKDSFITPTITENGPYLGIFLTPNQAVQSFQRGDGEGLLHNSDFNQQVGDIRNGASQLVFLDSPKLLDRAYRTAMPFVSMASMFNKKVATILKGHDLPSDLMWMAPMGTWSCVSTPDENGSQGYSVSGVGNQGILLGLACAGSAGFAQSMGFLPKGNLIGGGLPFLPGSPALPSGQAPAPAPVSSAPMPVTNSPDTSVPPLVPAPASDTNKPPPAPAPDSSSTTNSNPNATPPAQNEAKSQ